MKVLFNKIKKCNKVELTLYVISILYYIISYVLFTISILKFKNVETPIRIGLIIFFGIYFLYYFLSNLINMIIKKHNKFSILLALSVIFSLVFTIGSYYMNILYNGLNNLSEETHVIYTTNLITLKDKEFNVDSKIGIIQNKDDIEGYILPQELIKKENIKNETKTFNDYYQMIDSLYEKEIDAVFLSGNYVTIFSGNEEYEKIKDETTVVKSLSKEMENQDLEIKSDKELTEPFSILVMGVDSTKDGLNANAAFNGDTLMLITFNPDTLNATLFSIPRDTYVPIACRTNYSYKINSSAAYGTKCVIDTVEDLVDIDIDYYIKINFQGVIDLINAIGGIDVEVTKSFCESDSNRRQGSYKICLKEGFQHINGEQALAYARHRHTLVRGDIDRTKHQQLIVEATAKKLIQSISFSDFEKLLNTISKNISTNIDTNEILSFYDTIKRMLLNSLNGSEMLTIEKTYMEYYHMPVYLSNNRYRSAIGYYEDSLEAIKNAMKENLNLKKRTMAKSFSYDYNVDYEEKVIGKGLKNKSSVATVPDFVGKSQSEAINWGDGNNIKVNIEYVTEGTSKYNDEYEAGYIVDQSIRKNTRVENISNITIYVNK